jgi:large subunit ribosomal protein L1
LHFALCTLHLTTEGRNVGKIRVKTIGLEEDEKEQKKKAAQRQEKKRAKEAQKQAEKVEAASETSGVDPEAEGRRSPSMTAPKTVSGESKEEKAEVSPTESDSEPKKKTKKEKFKKIRTRSKSYQEGAAKIDKAKQYNLKEAISLLKDIKRAKFDETVELHINTNEKGVSGSLTLPHGTGKQMKVEIADQAKDPKKLEELIKKIEAGQIDFDILIATPDSMSHLARVARFLGPKGLMPNPKSGTVHPKPDEAAKKFEGGQMNFKTEAKAPVIHMSIGKLSFEENKLEDNAKAFLTAVQTKNIKSVTLKSTMSPGIKLSI